MSRRAFVVLVIAWLATLAVAYLIGYEVGEPEHCPREPEEGMTLDEYLCQDKQFP